MDRDRVSRFVDSKPTRGRDATSTRTMTLNESIVEDAALEWFGELIRANWGLFTPNELQNDSNWSERILAMNLAAG